ncbi:MAG: M48 family metallopeptidase [Chloroflexota bacterium]|nr:M48 family metallopeptidase [Chloroflexota bacterium]
MHQIDVNGLIVDVVRKNIKNLHLAVYPPNGRVRVAAPLLVNDEAVRMAVIARLGWVKRQQVNFQKQERETKHEYVNGESHYFLGNRYLLNIVEHSQAGKIVIRNKKKIDLYVRPRSDSAQRERIMLRWYRAHLRQTVPALIEKWEKIIGVQVAGWGIRQMKTKWGTCNIQKRRIWINLELAKKSEACLEFIVAHEIVHLLERHHNDRFLELMNKFMPKWKLYRAELNRAPLGHADWEY